MAKPITFDMPDLDAFAGLDKLGLTVTGQCVRDEQIWLRCETVARPPEPCPVCCGPSRIKDYAHRELAHVPVGWKPVTLMVRVRRYECREGCRGTWREDMTAAAAPRAVMSRAAVQSGLYGVVVNHLAMNKVARSLGVAWNTANKAILDAGLNLLIDNPARLDGVEVIGVDEHAWSHVSWKNKYVTVIIDLTPVRNGTGPARLLDVVPGRSKGAFEAWLEERPKEWRDKVETVSMDGFTGFKTAATGALPDAEIVMDPFHVVRLVGDALDATRRRIQQETTGRRGRKGDPLYGARHTLLTGAGVLTEKQAKRLEELFAPLIHAPVEAAWSIYQSIIAAYREPNRKLGKMALNAVVEKLVEP